MTLPIIPFEAEDHLDWIAVTDAIAAGHDLPRARIADLFHYRDKDTALTRSAWIDGLGLAVKTATIFPGNADRARPVVNGGVSLYSDDDGTLEAIVNFHLVTKWKTAADSLLAARRLAPANTRGILICGAGTVATSLVHAYRAAFPAARIAIWNRTRAKAERLAADTGAIVAGDLEQSARSADVISCATMSTDPVIRGEWLRPGQHLDLIGAYRPDMREADDEALRRSRIFVDSRETTLDHIGELKIPLAEGVITPDDVVADYYELDKFKRGDGEITLFKNGGGAHLDLMVTRHILERWDAARE